MIWFHQPTSPSRDGCGTARPRVLRIVARLNVGGPARHVTWLTAGLTDLGYESWLVTGIVPPGEEDMSYFAAAHGVHPVVVPSMSRALSPKDVLTVWKLFRLLRRLRPDIIHTHTAKAGTVGRLAGFLYRWLTPGALVGRPRPCRLVHTFHGHVFHHYFGPRKTRIFLGIEKCLARLATDRIVVISPQQFREIHHQFGVGRPHQFAIIPLGIDLGEFTGGPSRRQTLRHQLGASEGNILVGIVGRLTEVKNHPLFLQAAARYQAHYRAAGSPPVRFLVIGAGHLQASLTEMARTLGLHECLTFLGNRQDPETFYPALDVVALTSLNEGTPLTLIEAMANARPVIATAVGGVVDLVGEPTPPGAGLSLPYTLCSRGLLVPSENADAFACGLARLIQDEPLRRRLGQTGQDFIERHYSRERLLADMVHLYRELSLGIRH